MKKQKKIIASGFAKLNLLDDGFYGKGIYFSTSAIYTLCYCVSQPNPCIILSFLLPGNPYPVIEHPNHEPNYRGQSLEGGFQSHYVVTLGDGFPIEEKHAKFRTFNEIVIDQENQVVPIFLVFFSNKKWPLLEDIVQRDVPVPLVKEDESDDKEWRQISVDKPPGSKFRDIDIYENTTVSQSSQKPRKWRELDIDISQNGNTIISPDDEKPTTKEQEGDKTDYNYPRMTDEQEMSVVKKD